MFRGYLKYLSCSFILSILISCNGGGESKSESHFYLRGYYSTVTVNNNYACYNHTANTLGYNLCTDIGGSHSSQSGQKCENQIQFSTECSYYSGTWAETCNIAGSIFTPVTEINELLCDNYGDFNGLCAIPDQENCENSGNTWVTTPSQDICSGYDLSNSTNCEKANGKWAMTKLVTLTLDQDSNSSGYAFIYLNDNSGYNGDPQIDDINQPYNAIEILSVELSLTIQDYTGETGSNGKWTNTVKLKDAQIKNEDGYKGLYVKVPKTKNHSGKKIKVTYR